MTERGRECVHRGRTELCVGPSQMRWTRDALVIRIDEVSVPWLARLRGEIRVYPLALLQQSFALDAAGMHRWRPIAPCARVEVALQRPRMAWQGTGYFDSNEGDRALEQDFVRWDWSRGTTSDGRSFVLYDVARKASDDLALALQFEPSGKIVQRRAPATATLARSGWRMDRLTRCDDGGSAQVKRTMEDAPFYARTLVDTQLFGERVTCVHESLALERFASPWCQWMLPFRMPRIAR
ncbi:carotenoid 1,2-hydratase [Variovorax sp. J22R133]|uniref:carotenoid 1,2-hydratase n=1 Tax=Variovorax brevis TaxID=3053503 RepID=UPI0025761F01|nr:carotenoid 1,2-hydratase [Variovorax sp. J22R133]MDM0113788.1 carotenoid 1,2-hydratase [Variovorax sp. J22R133]